MRRREFITLFGGAAVTWPLAARAQSPQRMARIGYLGGGNRTMSPSREAFLQGLRALGYVEGQTFTLVERYADGQQERLPKLAEELVRLEVNVLVATTSGAVKATGWANFGFAAGDIAPGFFTTEDHIVRVVCLANSSWV